MKIFEAAYPLLHTPTADELRAASAKACGVHPSKIIKTDILRRSLDARGQLLYRYQIQAFVEGDAPAKEYIFDYKNVSAARPVIIIGGGPAGMFAALKLLEHGLKPVILERGRDVHSRKKDIAAITQKALVNPDSNYCYGEGGAGTFSDGKLYTRSSKRGDVREVLHQFVNFGAQEAVLTDAHPHIGSDVLMHVVENIRNCITDHGGEYHFGCRVTDIKPAGGKELWEVVCDGGLVFKAHDVILATGHSARDIYKLFDTKGWALEAKDFAMGVRVEHPQSLINHIQYHGKWQNGMPAAEYSLVQQVDGRGVFSFCMCPGGILVPSTTESNAVVLNGMSNSGRNSAWANSGIVAQVGAADVPGYEKYGVFALSEFQREVEEKVFAFSNSFKAPAQRMVDFCSKRCSASLQKTSYPIGAANADLHEVLPGFIADSLARAFLLFDRKMHGFYTNDALLLAVESRTSSAIRIPRDSETLCHAALPGLYPCGEGAGYAGGIVSSALDGIAVALAVADRN